MKTGTPFFIILLALLLLAAPAQAQKKAMLYPADTLKRAIPKPLMPYLDSITHQVTYSQTMEQQSTASDSLYARAFRFLLMMNGRLIEEKRNQKLVYAMSLPAYYYDSIGIKTNAGNIIFNITILIKEGRYRYVVSGIGNDPLSKVIAFEYALLFPNILHNAHEDINQLLRNLKRSIAEPGFSDEDEW